MLSKSSSQKYDPDPHFWTPNSALRKRASNSSGTYLGNSDVRDEGVELVGGVLVLVPQPGQADAHPDQHTVIDPDQGSGTPISGIRIQILVSDPLMTSQNIVRNLIKLSAGSGSDTESINSDPDQD